MAKWQANSIVIVDAHQHFWRLGENDCTWPTPDLAAIHRNFEPADLAPTALENGVAGTVLVQSQESDRDTDWLLAIAAPNDLVHAVVGWVDLKSPHAPQHIAELARHPKLRGLRPMLQGLPDDWIADLALDPAVKTMIAHRLSFDALVFTRHLPALCAFARRHPHLAIVIDHAAKPPIKARALDPWREEIAAAARLPNVSCKLSGMRTEAQPGDGFEALSPYVRYLLDVFGPDRLMWGSDWPVLELAVEYGEWLRLAEALTRTQRGSAAHDAIFGGTARAFYRLG